MPTATKTKRVAVKDIESSSDEEEFNGFNNPEPEEIESERDGEEEELERLVFGDAAGFRQRIKGFKTTEEESKGKELVLQDSDVDSGPGLETVQDADLYFIDTEPTALQEKALSAALEDDEDETGGDAPAWSDSDDERISISLATRPQLRKLRRTEAEDVISGKEYSRRLRKQFQILNPVPEWVQTATSGRPIKKRRTSGGSETSDSSSDEDMDLDGEVLTQQPLARLLQDADTITNRATTVNGAPRKRKFRPEVIDIQRMKDIVTSGPSAITCLEIHPTLPLLLSSGPSSTLSLHHLQPTPPNPNPLLTTLHIKHTPLTTTLFHPSPSDPRIFLGARRRYFHVWNLQTGQVEKISRVYGHQEEQRSMETFKISPDGGHIAIQGSARKGGGILNILDANTLQWVAQARVESTGGIADFAWWADSKGLIIAGKNGEMTEWDMEDRIAVARWKDDGAVGTTTIALGGKSEKSLGGWRYISVGSSSGIVNVYDRKPWHLLPTSATSSLGKKPQSKTTIPNNPTPLRILDQLVTPISHLAFSPCGQIMVMASRWKADALRLVHLPSCAVYRNWPTVKTPFGRVTSVAFGEVAVENKGAEGDLVLLVGNEKGAVRGWELRA
ncbi:putative U3 small nucleolar RNA-associated protein 18 [Venturia nashicola]|uniref:Putative U3 small nucleolar RNA-associated protein 18 n=1 Tax=Venturia nashicola TaxID=86259 RepID=A0A4Z1PBE6_9PEZI|nr:putative U3 small nucleolar RNA-associated protein 18 [Venturia nashicola]